MLAYILTVVFFGGCGYLVAMAILRCIVQTMTFTSPDLPGRSLSRRRR